MPALNFQKQFVEKVESGEKRQTIRAMRKRPFKVGDKLYLYYGMRTKQCRKLDEVDCKSVKIIIIYGDGNIFLEYKGYDKTLLSLRQKNSMARKDGFKDFYNMHEWFEKTHGLPFHGQLIKW